MTTDKQRMTNAGWRNLYQQMPSGIWYGIKHQSGGYWLGRDLTGTIRGTWYPDRRDGNSLDDALAGLALIKAEEAPIVSVFGMEGI